jgi:tetratricopeptide (TPR) repeat protein
VKKKATEQLPKVFRRDLIDPTSLFIIVPAASSHPRAWQTWFNRAYADSADTPYEFWCFAAYDSSEMRVDNAQRLQTISPYSPLAKAELLSLAWDTVKDQAEKWEGEAAPDRPRILTALGAIYLKQQRFDDAERCYKKAAEIEKSIESLQNLASVYYDQKKFDVWEQTLEKALELPDYGLSHAQIENQIAWHYLTERDPEKALPHAEAAATSYSGWGLETAATVYECLQQWDKAEAMYRATSERYEHCGSDLDWYFFCRRTGKGDVKAAKELADAAVDNPNSQTDPFNIICYRLLNNQITEALALLETEFKKDPHPWTGILIALFSDQQKDTARRDEVLKALLDREDEALKKPKNKEQKKIFKLAAILTRDLANGGKVEFDLDELEKVRPPAGNSLPFYYYALAYYYNQRDKTQEATDCWLKSITCTINNANIYRTLSAGALLEHGIGPEKYKDAWTTMPEKSDSK